jgi:hypothetical protein
MFAIVDSRGTLFNLPESVSLRNFFHVANGVIVYLEYAKKKKKKKNP